MNLWDTAYDDMYNCRGIAAVFWLELAHGNGIPRCEQQVRGAAAALKAGETADQKWEILVLFLKSSVDITTRPVLGLVIFQIAAIAASIVA
ncbi:hypothetical protein P4H94_09175 [Paenibacillus macerans]|uniref:Uncharacterized protein n=1 Tax=Paenibacillus macerans TaxID=44252 RepID=A0A090ZH32_PAEMA|nr:hypothetical protein [Paenibacillus macerans]KFN09962.1 hypothetical protein DJ90_640 [Paenibacillus macerans]MBS5909710.1 hypothetical protein [Paenibacillus macerans]MCY7557447.1 hypothetical protein [Paenibacillus macerans]MDU5948786.1 hypothetical protein [Paenibacillus macerans]MEC0137040.1 hypothetical protein [Paenibacillus macerans]